MGGDSPHAEIYFEKFGNNWTVFWLDATELYDFLAREAELYEEANHERFYTFRMDFVLSRCKNEAKSGGKNGALFSHWKQAVAKQLH